jgi:hypothetical protein
VLVTTQEEIDVLADLPEGGVGPGEIGQRMAREGAGA